MGVREGIRVPISLIRYMTIIKENRYFEIDHANKRLDRERVKPNLASLRQGTQREAAASKIPPGAADSGDRPSETED